MLRRRFFTPRRETSCTLPTEAGAALHVVDVFHDATGEQWLTLISPESVPYLLPGYDAEQLPPRLIEQLAVYELTREERPREIGAAGLYLMTIEAVEDMPGLLGATDPIYLDGIVTGPWLDPEHPPRVQAGQLIATRADVLCGFVEGVADGFVYAADPRYGNRTRVSYHLMLPGGSLEEAEAGRGVILAYPAGAGAALSQEPGNDGAVLEMCRRLLGTIRDQDDAAPPLLPKPDAPLLERLWETVFPRRAPPPPDRDPVAYGCHIQQLLEDYADWFGPRARALHRWVRHWRVFWTPHFSRGLRPYVEPGDSALEQYLEPAVEYQPNAVATRARHLYFDVDDTFAAELRGEVEVHVSCLRLGADELNVELFASRRRRGRLSRRTFALRGRHSHWDHMVAQLPAPSFSNALRGGTDFRLCLPPDGIGLREVVVRTRERTRPLPPQPVKVERAGRPPLLYLNDAGTLAQLDVESGELRAVGLRLLSPACRFAAWKNLLFTVDRGHLTSIDSVTGLVRLVGPRCWEGWAPICIVGDTVLVLDEAELHRTHLVTGHREARVDLREPEAMCRTQGLAAVFSDGRLHLVDSGGQVAEVGAPTWTEVVSATGLGAWVLAIDGGQLFAVERVTGERQPIGDDQWSEHARLTAADGWLFAADGDKVWWIDPERGQRHLIRAGFEHIGDLCALREADSLLSPRDLELARTEEAPASDPPDDARTIAALKRAIVRNPEVAASYGAIAALHQRRGDDQAALDWWTWQAIVDSAADEICVKLGELTFKCLRDVDGARAWYDEAIRRRPQSGAAHVGIGELYLDALHDKRQAQYWLRRARELDPLHAPAYTRLADIHLGSGYPSDAARALEEAHERFPTETWPLERLVEIYRDVMGDVRRTVQTLERLVELEPRRSAWCAALAEIYREQLGDQERADEWSARAGAGADAGERAEPGES